MQIIETDTKILIYGVLLIKIQLNENNILTLTQIFGRFVDDMSKYIKPNINEEDLGKNPYLKSLVIPVNKVSSEDRFKQDGNEWYKSEYEYDAASCCKVFVDAQRRKDMAKLAPRSKDLLLWIIYEVKKGKDYLWINRERYMEESGISSLNTYRSAATELIKNGYISKTVVLGYFWINPDLIFSGNRIKAFPDNVKVK